MIRALVNRRPRAPTSWLAAVSFVAVAWVGARAAPARDYWVSAGGNDVNPGTADAPFATLERGRDALGDANVSGGRASVRPGPRAGLRSVADEGGR